MIKRYKQNEIEKLFEILKNEGKEFIMKKIIKVLFILYCIILFFILFLYGARTGNQFNLAVFSKEHIEMVNVIPFNTIFGYIEKINNNTINTNIVVQNILANLLMFVPMGMALPVLWNNKFDKLWKVLVFIICLVFIVEIIQFMTFCGYADIDDLILNTIGCIAGYGIIQIKWLRNMIHNILKN